MGIGLKALKGIEQSEEILRIKTNMGLMSDTIIQSANSEDNKASDDFFQKMTDHTRTIANAMSPGNPGAANKFFHHLVLTQKLISQRRSSDITFESPM